MNIKNFILVLALIVQVRCDCDGYFKCLSSFVGDFFGSNVADDRSDYNDTELIDVESLKNKSLNVFDLSDVGRSLSQALSDVMALIKEEVTGVFNVADETDVHKDIENKTEIHVRAFSLNQAKENTEVKIPEVIINNLTKFNDELNALKMEIEKSLQAELEAFISQVLENDTADWVELTENSLTDTEFTTTVEPYPDFKEDVETTTQIFNNNIDDANISFGNEENRAAIPATVATKNPIKDTKKLSSNKTIESNKTSIKNTTVSTFTTDASKKLDDVSTTTPKMKISSKSNSEYNEKSENATFITSTLLTINSNNITTEIPITTVKLTNKNDVTTKTITPATEKTTEKLLSKKPKDIIEVKVTKQETQTAAPINYKIEEDDKENEISNEDPSYYEIQDDNTTDYPIIDYVDMYKDTTNEANDYIPTVMPDNAIKPDFENVIQKEDVAANNGHYTNDTTSPFSVLPWIAAIFIKNGTSNQFDYYCDGILLSDSVVLTASRCLHRSNVTVDAEDVIIFLGKRSLQASTDGESIHKVKQLQLHSNFSLRGDVAQNDLAVLRLEAPVVFNEGIQPACLVEGEASDAVTTTWAESLSLINFVEKNKTCEKDVTAGVFCATYGLTVALCPSYGGVYATKQGDKWCAGGVRTADPTIRGLCFDKTVSYTDLSMHRAWIDEIVK